MLANVLLVTASESKQDQHVDEEEFDDVDDHAAERNLQRPQVRTDVEYVDSLQITAQRKNKEMVKIVSLTQWNNV